MALTPYGRSSASQRLSKKAAALLCLFAVIGAFGLGAAPAPTEYQVKAAFLLNFTKFTEWPASSFQTVSSPLAICIIGGDPFGEFIDNIVQGEAVDGRKVVVRRAETPPEPGLCQIAYVNVPLAAMKKTIAALKPGVLTVGEGPQFVRDGGIIAFVLENNHVRFLINPATAGNAGLKLSSRLLSVARVLEQ